MSVLFATYRTATATLDETYFLRVGTDLYAYPSFQSRENAIDRWISQDIFPVALRHKDAHQLVSEGWPAFYCPDDSDAVLGPFSQVSLFRAA